MPTTHSRYTVTDTGPLARALDAAQALWPDLPRGTALLTKLATSGAEALSSESQARTAAVDALTQFGDAYYPGYLDELRQDWPE